MFVPCPHCGFLVALIVSGDGPAVACPRCNRPLPSDAAGNAGLDQVAPDQSDDPVTARGDSPERVESADSRDPTAMETNEPAAVAATPVAIVSAADADSTAAAVAPSDAPPPAPRAARNKRLSGPSFARTPVAIAARAPHWPALLIVAVLTTLLLLQLLLAQRAELAADARWRPWISSVCSVFRCTLPTWHQPDAYSMLARSVQPKPGQPGVLDVSASFRNDAHWPQAWPTLLLSLSDVDGRQVAARAFTPLEYRAQSQVGDQLMPGQSASIRFDVVEPAPRIVAFTFDFR